MKTEKTSPVCPYCGWTAPVDGWDVAVCHGEVTEPVECGGCGKYFGVESVVRWGSYEIKKQPKKKQFEVQAVYSTRYYATVEAEDEDEAKAIANQHGRDDDFWIEEDLYHHFNIDCVEELD